MNPPKLSCNLNRSENVCEYKLKHNITAPKLQRCKKGLHFGAQKVNPDLFKMKEEENIKKTSNIKLQPFNVQIEKCELQTHVKGKDNLIDEKNEQVKTSERNEFTKVSNNHLWNPKNGPKPTHTAQESMISIHEYNIQKQGKF